MSGPERSPERDRAIVSVLPVVEDLGWTRAALVAAAGPGADLLFPGGTGDMVEAYSDLADRWMEQDATEANLGGLRLPERVRLIVALRLRRNAAHRAAILRALGWLALPRNAAISARCTARTVDAIWHAAGDRSSDFSWYTKRVILGAVYSTTLLRWLSDDDPDAAATLAFLDRRLADVARIGKVRSALRLRVLGRPSASTPGPPQPT